jgi:hypothetical protein
MPEASESFSAELLEAAALSLRLNTLYKNKWVWSRRWEIFQQLLCTVEYSVVLIEKEHFSCSI